MFENQQLARVRLSVVIVTICLLIGCAQNRNGNPFAAAPGGPTQQNPYGAPQGPLRRALSARRAQPDVTDLYRRAQEQQRLAAIQQTELAQLRGLQDRYDNLVESLRRQDQLAEVNKQRQLAISEKNWAERAKDAVGRYRQLDKRAKNLDVDNRDLQSQLARTQQQYQLVQEQNELLRKRLGETVTKLTSVEDVARESQGQVAALQASDRRRGGTRITANNSLRKTLTAVSANGLEIKQDGELVRILLPSDQLFMPGTATMVNGAESHVDRAAQVILEHYPNQVVGVEAHTDNSPVAGSLWRNHHQMTAAQAMAIFEQMSYRHRLLPQQLFVLGHGDNYPIVSNGTTAGQARNRRVEIVIYPETVGSRR